MLRQTAGPTYYARLQFEDAAGCRAWISKLARENAIDAHEMVAAQVELLANARIDGADKLRLLELLYPAAADLQTTLAQRFVGHALPLSIVEYSVWNSVLALWQTLFRAYHLCLRRALKGDAAMAPCIGLLGLRCLDLTGAGIREHHAVYREVPGPMWKQLHEAYALAERYRYATTGIADPLLPGVPARSCTAAYGRALLAHLGNPYAMSPRQMSVMYRWVALWEPLVHVGATPRAPGATAALAVDLRAPCAAAPAHGVTPGPTVRYVDLEQLGRALRHAIGRLREGEDPASLGLGADCRQPGCERLLTLLYIQWCGPGMTPAVPSHERGEEARACVGLEQVLRQLASENEAFRAAAAAIRTAHSAYTEHWNLVSANAPGFVGVLRGPECDERIRHHQLIAIKRRSVGHFQLAVAQWLRLAEDGDLAIGLRLLPGIPHVTAMRSADDTRGDVMTGTALLLPAVAELRAGASLVLPVGTFRPGRALELLSGSPRRVRLTRLAEIGADFERAAFDLLA